MLGDQRIPDFTGHNRQIPTTRNQNRKFHPGIWFREILSCCSQRVLLRVRQISRPGLAHCRGQKLDFGTWPEDVPTLQQFSNPKKPDNWNCLWFLAAISIEKRHESLCSNRGWRSLRTMSPGANLHTTYIQMCVLLTTTIARIPWEMKPERPSGL